MNSTRYFGEARYKEAVRIENYRTLSKFFERPSYMTPEPTTFPKAEKGLCCTNQNSKFHFISHYLP